ncbi:MAG: prepilin-type N-terminal cleavage/methylation domain-containing protein [Nitrospirae bacterium]|nr:prepilin-type N-terminal cleavage/methylation domain-containing protein [Nitrospirota bacterium]
MGTGLRLSDQTGLTLGELVIAVAILAILSAMAVPAYLNFMKKAKMVEAEKALHEIQKLEDIYYNETDTYSDHLAAIGFFPIPSLRYYTITIELRKGKGKSLYEATAKGNLDGDTDLDAWDLAMREDGTTQLLHGCIAGGEGKINYTCSE